MKRSDVYFWVSVLCGLGLSIKGDTVAASIMMFAAVYAGLQK